VVAQVSATEGSAPASLALTHPANWGEDCSASAMGSQASMLGVDGAELCGCVYDDMSTESGFATFNEQWASDDFDPNSEFGQILTDAVLGCAMSGA
jgi:hypothetical protein